MNTLFKKAALFNAELISFGAEKVKDVADDFVRKGILNDQDAKRFVADVKEKFSVKERELEGKWEKIAKAGQELMNELRVFPKFETEGIDGRISDLERELDDLRQRREAVRREPRKEHARKDASKKDEATT